MKTSISTALLALLAVSLLLGGFGFLKNGDILRRLNTPADIMDQARLFFKSGNGRAA